MERHWMELGIVALAYVLGSIPFGLLAMRIAGKGDIRKQGSGNIGATNVTRVAGRKLGLLTLLLDAGKGVLAVVIARGLGLDPLMVVLAGLAAVVGHIFPLFLRFKGGKGVATTLAVLFILEWRLGLSVCIVWLAVFACYRISSLSAILAMIAAPSLAFMLADRAGGLPLVYATMLMSILVILRHRSNIRRLVSGEETRI